MTLSELKTKIAESPNKESYLNYQISFNFPQISHSATLTGVPALYEFILRQIEGFAKYKSLPSEFSILKKRFDDAKKAILTLIESKDVNKSVWDSNLHFLTNNSPKVFLFNSPETEFLLNVHQERPQYYKGAYEFITGTLGHLSSKDYYIGYLLAYEFISKGFPFTVERKEMEERSISSMRVDFQNKLGEIQTEMTKYLAKANQEFVEYCAKIDEFKNEKNSGYTSWFNKTTTDFEKFNADSSTKMKDLEDLYMSKLKLEAPAKYWSDRAKKLRKEGYGWLIGLTVCIVAGVLLLIWILNSISGGALQSVFGDTSSAIKWSIALITLISFLAYAIRVFSKLTFSSFHLVRDAEEREQLTYVYLALQKEKGIDQTERHLIMQSLFSRADSGLLRDEASPTMPGNIVDQVIKK
jgi:hypothetical protein